MEKKIEELKSRLRNIDTKELLGWIATQFVTSVAEGEEASEASDIFKIDCQVKCNKIREKIFEAPRRESGN